jgi:hypothetical protein
MSDLCFRMGKPPLIRREDLTIKKPQSFSGNDVALPGRPPVSRIGCSLSDVSDQLLLFNNNIEMAHLLREIYDVTSSRIDLDHLSERASHLDRAVC